MRTKNISNALYLRNWLERLCIIVSDALPCID